MSFGDTRYEFYSASVNATNSSAVQTFFGTYSGLSLLNNDDVVHIQVSASANEFFLGPIGQVRKEWRVRRGISQLSVGGGVARQSYLQKIIAMFGTSLIGYWPGSEEAGTVAVDYSGNGYNGVYTGVTLGQEGTGDGLTCPLYDGANDFMQPPAGFRTALNVSEGTIGLWAKVSGAGVWTDATTRNLFFLSTDATNRILLRRSTTNNQLSHAYVAGGTTESVTFTTSTIDWFHTAIT